MLREQLDEIQRILGGPVLEAKEDEVAVERDPTEVAFLKSAYQLLRNINGKVYATSQPSAYLTLLRVKGLVADPMSEKFEFVLPLFVQYEGQASPEIWSEAEKAMEAEMSSALGTLAADGLTGAPEVRLIRRKKSDPFKDDPRSLTLLSFRAG